MKIDPFPYNPWSPCFVWGHVGDEKTRKFYGVAIGPYFFGIVKDISLD